jgi:ribosomal protein S18 acetylase RimI-like enzyme
MEALLAAGTAARNGCTYVHPGDLRWWLGYSPNEAARCENITLWETPAGDLAAWVLLDTRWRTFDVFFHPDWFAHPAAGELVAWAAGQAARKVAATGQTAIRTMWISAEDPVSSQRLAQLGFTPAPGFYQLMHIQLEGQSIPAPALPPGYGARPIAGMHEVQPRAAASHAAFESSLPFEAYWPRYQRFMESPLYPAGMDLIIESPDGRVAAFCIGWLDPQNRIGSFEPVGVHPDFQRRGLGKAILHYGMQRMQTHGMTAAIVGTHHDNHAAMRLYESVGFRPGRRMLTYETTNLEDM